MIKQPVIKRKTLWQNDVKHCPFHTFAYQATRTLKNFTLFHHVFMMKPVFQHVNKCIRTGKGVRASLSSVKHFTTSYLAVVVKSSRKVARKIK